MSINFHDANNKYTYAQRNAHISWREMIKNITDVQNKRIIDIGCGGGIYTKELALMGAESVVGLDFSKEILQAAKENCSGFSNISFIQGDAHSVPYPNDTFDIVISRAVIHHLQDVPTFLREASRILKKNHKQAKTTISKQELKGPQKNIKCFKLFISNFLGFCKSSLST